MPPYVVVVSFRPIIKCAEFYADPNILYILEIMFYIHQLKENENGCEHVFFTKYRTVTTFRKKGGQRSRVNVEGDGWQGVINYDWGSP